MKNNLNFSSYRRNQVTTNNLLQVIQLVHIKTGNRRVNSDSILCATTGSYLQNHIFTHKKASN